jgi:hypothetical protein
MRYAKMALLAFGLGLLLGLVVIVAEIKALERFASGLMALGIAAIPFGIIADWWRSVRARLRKPKRRAKAPVGRALPAARRRRKAAPPKR